MSTDQSILEQIAEAARGAPHPPSMSLRPARDATEFGRRLEECARRVAEATGGAIALTVDTAAEDDDVDQLTLRIGDREVVHYQALPEGPEEAPFYEALLAMSGSGVVSGPAEPAPPMQVLVFIAPTCPNCPQAVRAVTGLAAANPHITATIVDAMHHEQWAARVGVRSVPLTIIDDALTLVGVITEDELSDRIMTVDGPDRERAIFVSLLDAGRFSAAAQRMIEGPAAEIFVERWRSSSLESRIGLVLTAEEALELDPGALDALVPELLAALGMPDAGIRGDTADLLGRIGDSRAIPALEELCRDSVADVAEVAAEALEEIRSRGLDRG
jgi:hypothetical protein